MSNKEIYNFAIKWLNKFKDKNKNLHEIFETMEFPEDCWKIGIEMDAGRLFNEKFGPARFSELELLKRIISNVDDINALGNLIFSKWRWFNHGDYVVYEPEDEEWFIIALTRLAELTKE